MLGVLHFTPMFLWCDTHACAMPVPRRAILCSCQAATCLIIIPSGAPINYQPEWQTPTHTKVPELVRRFTSSLGAGSFRMNGARSKNARMFVFVMPKGSLLIFLLFFTCEAPNRKVEWVQRGSLYGLFLCFSYARLQTVKWSGFKKVLKYLFFFELTPLYGLEPRIRKTMENTIKWPSLKSLHFTVWSLA